MTEPNTSPGTRDLILDAFERALGRYGFRKMTMDDLAHEAGVSKRTIYLHFHSKEELGLEMFARISRRVSPKMDIISTSEGDIVERLRQMLRLRVMERVKTVTPFRHALHELIDAIKDPYTHLRIEVFGQEADLIRRVLDEGVQREVITCRDLDEAAELLIVATGALIPCNTTFDEYTDPKNIERLLDPLINLLLRGLSM